ncbi:hypothetical protein, partial [Intestinimonas butyriciproducens]|uniref:hypothetical protein n=1 Tax=Intestinimonas butyriciproducens TaxID=1297617 RepID=UPI0034A4D310
AHSAGIGPGRRLRAGCRRPAGEGADRGGEKRRGRWPTVMARVDSVEDDGCNWEPLWEEP